MPRLLDRLRESARWRVRRFARIIYSTNQVLFWIGEASDAAWYPDLTKLTEIALSIGVPARRALPEDIALFQRYAERTGRALGRRRKRKLQERWAKGDRCYIALDRDGDIIAYMWAAQRDLYVEALAQKVPVPAGEVMHYDVETRTDRNGSMGFLACACVALADEVKDGIHRVVSWGDPALFEAFQRFHWWSGLGTLKPQRLVSCTTVLGLRFRRSKELNETWTPSGN